MLVNVFQKTQSVLLLEGATAVARDLEVFGVVVVGGAQMDAVVALGRGQGLPPSVVGLVEVVEQVVALTAYVQLLCVFLLEDRKEVTERSTLLVWKVPWCVCGAAPGRGLEVVSSQRMWRRAYLWFQDCL